MSITQTKMRGYEGQLYYTLPGGSETLFANITDFDLDVKAASIDVSDHSTQGWEDKLGGLKSWTGTIKAMAIQSGTDEVNFFNALVGDSTLTGSFRPEDITGAMAYTGSFVITGYKHSAPNAGAQTIDITIEGRGALVLGTVAVSGS